MLNHLSRPAHVGADVPSLRRRAVVTLADFTAARRSVAVAAALAEAGGTRPDVDAVTASVRALVDVVDATSPLHPRIAGSAPHELVSASLCELRALLVIGGGAYASLTGGVLKLAAVRLAWLGDLLDDLLPHLAAALGDDLADAARSDPVAAAEALLDREEGEL